MTAVASVSEATRRVSAIPLYRLEAARRRLEDLFEGGRCCMYEIDDFHLHGGDEPRDNPEYLTLKDLLDDLIEEARP